MGGRNVPVRSTDIIASRNISEKTNMKMVSVENLMRLIHLRLSPEDLGKRGQGYPRQVVHITASTKRKNILTQPST
jgi:hypothetical protein